MKRISVQLSIVLIFSLCSLGSRADTGEGVSAPVNLKSVSGLSGVVNDAETGLGIPDAYVFITLPGGMNLLAMTNSQGQFSKPEVPVDVLILHIMHSGYHDLTKTIPADSVCYFHVMNLVPSDSCIVLSDKLSICADEIEETQTSLYTLNGNVKINDILGFSGQVVVDKRPNLYYPEISGNGMISALDILGTNQILTDDGKTFLYYVDDNNLIPKCFDHFIDAVTSLGGFNVKIGQFIIAEDGGELEMKTIAELPFPLNKVFEHHQTLYTNPYAFIEEFSFSDIYNKTTGRHKAGSVDGFYYNFGLFAIIDGNLTINTATDLFGGGFSLKIPGRGLPKGLGDAIPLPDSTIQIPVILPEKEGQAPDTIGFQDSVPFSDKAEDEFFKIGVHVEFISGGIDEFILWLGVHIPIGATGLFITELTGGIDNFVREDDWRLLANVDIETGLEHPVLGSPFVLNDIGVNVHPLDYFKGSGTVEIFGHEAAGARIEYSHRKLSLSGEVNLNLANIVTGKLYLNLKRGEFTGGGEHTYRTPPDLPWFLNWAENRVFQSASTSFLNDETRFQFRGPCFSFASKMVFGKPEFPWFHMYFGTDYDHLVQIWKGAQDGKAATQFLVPENCPQLLLVAGDTTDFNVIDFQLIDPDGRIYDSTWRSYYHFPGVSQTLMVVNAPLPGEWTFLCDDTTHVRMEPWYRNQQPTGFITLPLKKASLSKSVEMYFTDYADTLDIRIFYDTDSEHFDGSLIQEFRVVNNARLQFDWQTDDIPDGEYYIYCMIDDRKNAPVMMYAPGSILVENTGFTEAPQNVSIVQVADSVYIQWDESQHPDVQFTTLYYQDISTMQIEQVTVSGRNDTWLHGLEAGQAYRFWCVFVNTGMARGPASAEQVYVVQAGAGLNNPPYFTTNPRIPWRLSAGDASVFELEAADADGELLTFGLLYDTLGMVLTGSQVSWTPSNEQQGAYLLTVTVSDGEQNDTTRVEVFVYSEEQTTVEAAFSSVNLHRDDNMFVKINNYHSQATSFWVTLTNLRTNDSADIQCRKVDVFGSVGRFVLSHIPPSDLPVCHGDSILLTYAFGGEIYTALARYDSIPQLSDNTPPAAVSDLQIQHQENNQVKLIWTASGDDGYSGRAYKYDIRYSFSPIQSEADFFTANRILNFPYPSQPGLQDSLLISLDDLEAIQDYDSIWFAIKVEDAGQNRSSVSNSPSISICLIPKSFSLEVTPDEQVLLDWEGIQQPGFQHYLVFRRAGDAAYQLLTDSLTVNAYTDDLYQAADDTYHYALQAVYTTCTSDTLFAEPLVLERFSDVAILCQLEDTYDYENVSLVMTGLDSLYQQQFSTLSGENGLSLLPQVFHGRYLLSLSCPGYVPYSDTLQIDNQLNNFVFTLWDAAKLRMVQGSLRYSDSLSTPLDSVWIRISGAEETVIDSVMTGDAGAFTFNLPCGSYCLSYFSEIPWGGVNAIDALLIMRHFAAMDTLTGLAWQAADLNADLSRNAIDALLNMKRFTGMDDSFVADDWFYDHSVINVMPGSPLIFNIRALCAGDVNASYVP